jgi:hypothetical protein
VVREFADTIKAYGLTTATADNYALQWPRDRFAEHGVDVGSEPMSKSKIYLTMLPLLNSRRVELLDSAVLVKQLCNLQRRTAHGGQDSVDHPRGQHDDVVNVAALVLVALSRRAALRIPLGTPVLVHKDGTSTLDSMPGDTRSASQRYLDWAGNGGGGGGTYWGPV